MLELLKKKKKENAWVSTHAFYVFIALVLCGINQTQGRRVWILPLVFCTYVKIYAQEVNVYLSQWLQFG